MKRKTLVLLACLGLAGCDNVAGGFEDARNKGLLTACVSNLKNISTAQEMYSVDNAGSYAKKLEGLTPSYLRTLPSCPAAGKVTYEMQFAPKSYSVFCKGTNHAALAIPADYPCLYEKDTKASAPSEVFDAPGKPHSRT